MMKIDLPKNPGRTAPPRIRTESGAPGHAASYPATPAATLPDESGHVPPRRWFLTFMCMNIPIVGWIYLLALAFGKKKNLLRDFAKAYLLYKLVFLAAALVLLGIMVYIGLDIADKLLAYMEML